MNLFPFFEDIEGKTFLIVGGGSVAAGKVSRLLQFTNRIVVIAPESDITAVEVIKRPFSREDLLLGDYVVAATDDRQLNKEIAALCRMANKPVNVADDPSLCSFFFPAAVRKGALTVGITTAGSSPAYAQMLRKTVEESLPEHLEEVLDRMQEIRRELPGVESDQKRRRQILHKALKEMLERPERCDWPLKKWIE